MHLWTVKRPAIRPRLALAAQGDETASRDRLVARPYVTGDFIVENRITHPAAPIDTLRFCHWQT